MGRLQLVGGAYAARSIIANAQRCINYFPEANRTDAPTPFTYYQRGGFRPKAQGPNAPVRCLYQASNGNGYCVIGQGVYSISPAWGLTLLGSLVTPGIGPCAMIDNGITLMVVDNSALGYTVNLTTNAFAQIVDATGTFTGATRVDYIDTFIVWNIPGTNQFGSTLSNSIAFDALYVAGKSGYPDKLQSIIVSKHEVILPGTLKGEIWYDSGAAQFPFEILPGAYIEHGVLAPYSLVTQDIETFWLGKDLQGQGIVFGLKGYDTRRISNFALEEAIRKMALTGSISDAIGYTYQQGGHVFYVLTFPTGNQTWVYDASLGADPSMAWHQRGWTDANGTLNRDRSNCGAVINGITVVGDWQNGTIYQIDPDYYVDTVGGVDYSIVYTRGFPHVVDALSREIGQPALVDGKRIQFHEFRLDLECGNGPLDANGNDAQVGLRWSIDRGKTFGNTVMQSAGAPGDWLTQPNWAPLGIARDMVFEIQHNIAGAAALNSAWVDATMLMS